MNDILLFILRCLFLLILAFVLAAPFWQRNQATTPAKGLVLIPKENFKETCKKFKFIVDSLSKNGYEFHFFDEKLQKIELYKTLNDSLLKDNHKVKNYWELVAKLDEKLPANLPVYLLTPNQAKYFTGSRPSVSLNLHWQTYTPADSVSTWIESAWFTNSNSIKVTAGNSKPSGTYFTNYIIQSARDPKSPFTVDVSGGKPVISLKTSTNGSLPIDTSTLRIAIYTDKYSADAAYLKAALEAVISFTQQKAIVKQYTNAAQIPAGQSWIFWLSDKPIDSASLGKAGYVFNYEPGKVITASSWIKINGAYSLTDQQATTALYQLVKKEASTARSVWVDGYGNSVLTQEQGKQTTEYHFYTRLNPTWNDLVWSDNFPKLLLSLISYNADNKIINDNEKSILAHQQLMPNIISSVKNPINSKITEQVDLGRYFWLLLAVVFCAERWLAHKNKLVLKHG